MSKKIGSDIVTGHQGLLLLGGGPSVLGVAGKGRVEWDLSRVYTLRDRLHFAFHGGGEMYVIWREFPRDGVIKGDDVVPY